MSRSLNGVAQYGAIFSPNYVPPLTQYTVVAFVYATANVSFATICKNWGDTVSGAFHFGLDSTGTYLSNYLCQSNSSTIGPVVDTTALPLNAWVHTAAVADGSNIRLYRDGASVGTPASYNGTLARTLNGIGIGAKLNDGASAVSGAYWTGNIGHIALWDVGLTPAEILQLKNGADPRTIRPNYLRHYWRMNDGTSTSESIDLAPLAAKTTSSPLYFDSPPLAPDPPVMFKAKDRVPLPKYWLWQGGVSTGTNVNITGVAGIGVAGSIASSIFAFPSGASGTGVAGSLHGAPGGGLSGAAGTGVAGTITASMQAFLSGASGTGAAGSFTFGSIGNVGGVAGTGVAGSLTASLQAFLAEASGIGVAGLLSGQVTTALQAVSGTGAAGGITPQVTGNANANVVGVAGIGIAGIITVTGAIVALTGGGNGGKKKKKPAPTERVPRKGDEIFAPRAKPKQKPAEAGLGPDPIDLVRAEIKDIKARAAKRPDAGESAPVVPAPTAPEPEPEVAAQQPEPDDEHEVMAMLGEYLAHENKIRGRISAKVAELIASLESEMA